MIFAPGNESRELFESWVNGNKTDVINTLARKKPLQAALVAAYVYDMMEAYDKGVFGRMLESRASSTRQRRARAR